MYCGKKRLVPSNDEVSIELIEGWNEIQVLLHIGDLINRADLSTLSMPSSMNIGKINLSAEKLFRADLKPLTITEEGNLYRNVSVLNNDYYAIVDREILLNYDAQGTNFQLVYNEQRREDVTTNIIIRATLKREDNILGITPKIKSIRVRSM